MLCEEKLKVYDFYNLSEIYQIYMAWFRGSFWFLKMISENQPFWGAFSQDFNLLDRTSLESSHYNNRYRISPRPPTRMEIIFRIISINKKIIQVLESQWWQFVFIYSVIWVERTYQIKASKVARSSKFRIENKTTEVASYVKQRGKIEVASSNRGHIWKLCQVLQGKCLSRKSLPFCWEVIFVKVSAMKDNCIKCG